jgi:hypothetical protein
VQRQEDLPAWEPVRKPVRGVHRERGLADPGHPADGVDPHHPPASAAPATAGRPGWVGTGPRACPRVPPAGRAAV